ncbi:MAG: EthD family reductase [Pseudomonadales bacterium]
MINVSVMYPNSEGATFDFDYYAQTHMPLAAQLLGDVLKGVQIERGIAGALPGQPAPFIAIGHLQFESLEVFQQAFAPHAAQILADIPNFSNVQPQVQISHVELSSSSDHSH